MWVPSPFRSAGLARGFNTVQQGPRQLQNVLARLQARIEEQRMMSLLEVGGGPISVAPWVVGHGQASVGVRRSADPQHACPAMCGLSEVARGGAYSVGASRAGPAMVLLACRRRPQRSYTEVGLWLSSR